MILALLLAAWAPDQTLTPGLSDPAVTQTTISSTICRSGYTKIVRNVGAAEKRLSITNYLAAHVDWPRCRPIGDVPCEYDHLIPLELGGANGIANLWPQPYCNIGGGVTCFGARQKDKAENSLKRDVCAGRITLDVARAKMLRWFDQPSTIPTHGR